MNIKRFKITEVIFFLIIWKSLFWSFILVIWNKQIINAYLTCSFSTYTSKLFYLFFCSFNLICIMHHSLICTNNDESFHLSSTTWDSVGVGVIVVLYGWERLLCNSFLISYFQDQAFRLASFILKLKLLFLTPSYVLYWVRL